MYQLDDRITDSDLAGLNRVCMLTERLWLFEDWDCRYLVRRAEIDENIVLLTCERKHEDYIPKRSLLFEELYDK